MKNASIATIRITIGGGTAASTSAKFSKPSANSFLRGSNRKTNVSDIQSVKSETSEANGSSGMLSIKLSMVAIHLALSSKRGNDGAAYDDAEQFAVFHNRN